MSISIVAAVLARLVGPAESDEPRPLVQMRWQAPAQCPAFEDVAGAIEALTDVAPSSGPIDAADLRVEAQVEESPSGFSLEMTLHRPARTQTRKLQAEDCAVLARAAAIVVAVALDPVQAAASWPAPKPTADDEAPPEVEPEVETPEPEPESESRPTPRPEPPRRAPVPQTTSPSLEYGGAAALSIAGRILPGVGPGFELTPFVGIARVHARLPLQVRPARRQSLEGNTAARANFTLLSAGPRVCPNAMPIPHRVRVPVCLGADLGAVIAQGGGDGVRDPRGVFSFWAAVVAEAGVSVQVAPRVSVFSAFELAVSLSRPSFFFDGGGSVHEVARLGPRGMLGVQFHRRRDFP